MIRALEGFYASCMSGHSEKEGFYGGDLKGLNIPLVLAIVTVEILVLIVGKYLWNNYLVKAVNIVNPIDSVLDLLAVSILIKLLISCC